MRKQDSQLREDIPEEEWEDLTGLERHHMLKDVRRTDRRYRRLRTRDLMDRTFCICWPAYGHVSQRNAGRKPKSKNRKR